jgi:hypothetical protein
MYDQIVTTKILALDSAPCRDGKEIFTRLPVKDNKRVGAGCWDALMGPGEALDTNTHRIIGFEPVPLANAIKDWLDRLDQLLEAARNEPAGGAGAKL